MSKPLFIYWPKCSTCRRALDYLNENNIEVETRDIMNENPTKDELKQWFQESGYPIKRFFNTSGFVYRDMGLKDKLGSMSEDEQLDLLASTGRLVRRPILIGDHGIFVGFHKDLYDTLKK
ncbi:ArsC family transcriptional regulator [Erysipelothrix larvae]|uniref:ArsC family transcriptional regulator n=1 Tax=Erysipelothrix larvae TaxID=1514105 RepID=A0A0X8H1L4_9FIRM|nr:arsenate reductase family protein [Erysipelothrix larvae]AMC94437.1 ArsC family transcriptional regulator [Erysipelothrix larvae]